MGISASELKQQSRKPIGASNDRLEPRMEAHPPRLSPGSLENGYEKGEAAERYDRSEAIRLDGDEGQQSWRTTP